MSTRVRVVDLSPTTSRLLASPTIGIVGLGYVGLPTALAFASAGSTVIGFDISESRLERIRACDVDLVPADQARLRSLLGQPELTLTSGCRGLSEVDAVIVCVPTPVDEHLAPDLTALREACRTVVDHATPGQTVILTSTSYVGCTRDLIVRPLGERGLESGRDVFVAFSPERIDPGNVKHPQHTVPRVVGGISNESTERAAEVLGHVAPVHRVSSMEAAEMTKLLENTFRAVNIAMINEFATAAQALGVEIGEVITAATSKPYGFMPFWPGPGVGGHCIPCDPHYLLWQLRKARVPMPLVDQAMNSIAERPGHVVRRIVDMLSGSGKGIRGARVMVVGVTYKPGVADLRESSALEIIPALARAGAVVSYTDSYAPSLRLGGAEMRSIEAPAGRDYDLVLVHTIHRLDDLSWIDDCPLVLDATYRLPTERRTAVI